MELKQGYHDPHETSRQYEQRCRAAWREAGWPADEPALQQVLYDIIWTGLHPAIKSRIKPLRNDETGRFKDLDELFRRAAAADQIKDIQAKQQVSSSSNSRQPEPGLQPLFIKKLTYLSRYLARRERVDGDETGLMKAMEQMQLSGHELDKFTPHRTRLKPRIAL